MWQLACVWHVRRWSRSYGTAHRKVSTSLFATASHRRTILASSPLRAGGCDGATRRQHPSQGHGSSRKDFHQMPRCMAGSRDSKVPEHFSFSPDFDAELPAVPAHQRAMLHPHQLPISTSRKLLACPWRPCVPARTEKHQESENPHDRAESPNCACATAPPRACSAGRHCEHVSDCCCLSSTWLIGSALIASCDEDAACS